MNYSQAKAVELIAHPAIPARLPSHYGADFLDDDWEAEQEDAELELLAMNVACRNHRSRRRSLSH